MSKSRLTAADIDAAERAQDDRRQSRKKGFGLMSVRDQGAQRLSNGVVMMWPTFEQWSEQDENGVSFRLDTDIPDGKFILSLENKSILFDTEEFRRFLRWA